MLIKGLKKKTCSQVFVEDLMSCELTLTLTWYGLSLESTLLLTGLVVKCDLCIGLNNINRSLEQLDFGSNMYFADLDLEGLKFLIIYLSMFGRN